MIRARHALDSQRQPRHSSLRFQLPHSPHYRIHTLLSINNIERNVPPRLANAGVAQRELPYLLESWLEELVSDVVVAPVAGCHVEFGEELLERDVTEGGWLDRLFEFIDQRVAVLLEEVGVRVVLVEPLHQSLASFLWGYGLVEERDPVPRRRILETKGHSCWFCRIQNTSLRAQMGGDIKRTPQDNALHSLKYACLHFLRNSSDAVYHATKEGRRK